MEPQAGIEPALSEYDTDVLPITLQGQTGAVTVEFNPVLRSTKPVLQTAKL